LQLNSTLKHATEYWFLGKQDYFPFLNKMLPEGFPFYQFISNNLILNFTAIFVFACKNGCILSIDFVNISNSIYRQVNITETGSISRFIDSAIFFGGWPIALRLFIVHVIINNTWSCLIRNRRLNNLWLEFRFQMMLFCFSICFIPILLI